MSEFQEVLGRSACSPCRPEHTKFEAQVSKNALFPSRLLECTRPVTPPSLRPGQVEPFLPPTRAISAAVGQNEKRPPLEAAVPQNKIYHRRCWLALWGKKMWFEGEADF